MESFSNLKALSDRYSKLKNDFLETERSLAKFTGYERSLISVSSKHRKQHAAPPQRRISLWETFNKQSDHQNIKHQKSNKTSSESSEESHSEDDSPPKKVALQSAIVSKAGGPQSRREVISKQNSCLKMQSRNRRFVGILQSTLQKFQNEERERQPQDLKRKKILEKVEAAEEKEKELAKKQKMELISKTKEQQLELKCLETMMKITESFELWEQNQKYLLNFNRTKAEPQICFLPVKHTSNSKKHLETSRREIQETMKERKSAVEVSLAKIKESYQPVISVDLDSKNASPKSDEVPVNKTDLNSNKEEEEEAFSSLSDEESDFLHNMLY